MPVYGLKNTKWCHFLRSWDISETKSLLPVSYKILQVSVIKMYVIFLCYYHLTMLMVEQKGLVRNCEILYFKKQLYRRFHPKKPP